MLTRLSAIAARAHVAPAAGVCLALVEKQPQTFLVGATPDLMAAASSIRSAADHSTGIIASRIGFRVRAMLQANLRCIGTRWQRGGACVNAALKIKKSRRSQAAAVPIAVKIPNSIWRSLIATAKVRTARASLSCAQVAA